VNSSIFWNTYNAGQAGESCAVSHKTELVIKYRSENLKSTKELLLIQTANELYTEPFKSSIFR
jgi:hypothetical protein